MILCATTLAVLLVIGGVEENPGPVVEAEKIMRVLCCGCERILKSGTQCDTCERWFHNSCGNVRAQVAESRKWVCDECRSERLRLLEEKLQDALHQIDFLTRKNKALEEQLQMAAAGREDGRHDTVQGHLKGGEYLVLGDSIIRNVGTECADMKVECFPTRLEWVANTLGVTFADPNSWVDDWDFSRDSLHLNRRGARHLGQLYSRVCGISGRRQKMRGD
jgi:hypothetical protein